MQIKHLWVVHLPEDRKPASLSSDLFLGVESLLGTHTRWTHIIHTLEKVHQQSLLGTPTRWAHIHTLEKVHQQA